MKSILFLGVLVSFLSACGPSHSASPVDSPPNPTNAPPNGSFEDWTAVAALPTDWLPAGGNGTYARIAGYDSPVGLELRPSPDVPAADQWVRIRSSAFAVNPGNYLLEAYAYGAFNLTAGLRGSVVWLNASGGELARSDVATSYPPPIDWKRYSWPVTAPVATASAYVELTTVYVPSAVDEVTLAVQ